MDSVEKLKITFINRISTFITEDPTIRELARQFVNIDMTEVELVLDIEFVHLLQANAQRSLGDVIANDRYFLKSLRIDPDLSTDRSEK